MQMWIFTACLSSDTEIRIDVESVERTDLCYHWIDLLHAQGEDTG